MAYVPDEAIDKMSELSAGAWRLYCFLARCRNQRDGKCCPSLTLTMETIGAKKSQTYEFRKELVKAGWAKFEGNAVTELFGFNIPKSRTVYTVTKAVGPIVLAYPKAVSDIPENSDISESDSDIPENNSEIPENNSEIPESFSDIPETHIRKNQQNEPAKLTSKIEQDMSGAVAPVVVGPVQQIFAYWQSRLDHPQAKLTAKRKRVIEARLKEKYTVEEIKQAIDGCASSPWHMGQNDRATVYDDIELICRDGGKLENFISNVNGRNGNGKLGHLSPEGQATGAAAAAWLKQKQEENRRAV